MPYFHVSVKFEIEAGNADLAQTAVQEYVDHLLVTGAEADLLAPENYVIEDPIEV